jgi:hypothetical protein
VITRKPYVSDAPQRAIHYEIEVGGKPLARNQEATLERGIGYPAGRYRFQYAEEHPQGWCLMFFGPVRRAKQRYRQVWDTCQVRTIHRPVGHPESFGADA